MAADTIRVFTAREMVEIQEFGKKGDKPYSEDELKALSEGTASFKLSQEAMRSLERSNTWWNSPMTRAEAGENLVRRDEFTDMASAQAKLHNMNLVVVDALTFKRAKLVFPWGFGWLKYFVRLPEQIITNEDVDEAKQRQEAMLQAMREAEAEELKKEAQEKQEASQEPKADEPGSEAG